LYLVGALPALVKMTGSTSHTKRQALLTLANLVSMHLNNIAAAVDAGLSFSFCLSFSFLLSHSLSLIFFFILRDRSDEEHG
jgi:hypothetical protein